MNSKNYCLVISLTILAFLFFVFSSVPASRSLIAGQANLLSLNYNRNFVGDFLAMLRPPSVVEVVEPEVKEIVIERMPTPEIVRGVYLTSWSASLSSRIDYVKNLAKTSGVNAVVVDIKDYTGYVAYDSLVPSVISYGAKKIKIQNVKKMIKTFHDSNIYVIARIAVFQDPILSSKKTDLAVYDISKSTIQPVESTEPNVYVPWIDRSGLGWVDPASEETGNYNISIAKEAWELGFDEINFDYVRFPSDGSLANMGFPSWDGKTAKHLVIKNFFMRARKFLPDVKLSVDLFGLATINKDDLGIGQVIEDAYDYFDYVCPMVYPSHYASGFKGYANPADYPYEVIKYSMETAQTKLDAYKTSLGAESPGISAKLRPWIQDFNMGATYNSVMVKKEIDGTKDGLGESYNGFLVWSPSNVYNDAAIKLDAFPIEKPEEQLIK